jgi:Rrf2 family protein
MYMKISTRGRYSLRMLLDLAERRGEGFVPLKDIAQRQGISKKYLEQIVTLLSNSGFLRTSRGYQGGYMLAKEPGQYTVGQVLRITEGGLEPVACLEDEDNICDRAPECKALSVWQGLQQVVDDYLDGITLQGILDDHAPGGGGAYSI